ncbi:winged helix-turn-helix transcriptional regulator [Kitasatospora sp. NBC_00315]|uniref:winged helix-turn-helix transcriptional regulator n=1 Tax=Kitasatospora sp. NBC_00315 TaxID=2975963 RepID=UPI003251082F
MTIQERPSAIAGQEAVERNAAGPRAVACEAGGVQAQEQELDVLGQRCPSRSMFAELADKWSLLILMSLGESGEQRFSELQRGVGGVSRKMLTQSLRTLERHGLVRRTVHPQTPPRVVYSLLPPGRELAALVAPLGRWTELNTPLMLAAREGFDRERDTGCADGDAAREEPR